MAAALASFNRLGHVNAGTAAEQFGVSEGTIRRWIRDGVPASRRSQLIALVRPPQGAFDQEQKDLVNARNAVAKIAAEPANATALWGYKGWLEKHDLAVIKINDMPVHTMRIARTDRDRDADRRLRAGGEIVAIATFPNMFAATIARSELLEDVYAYRVQLRNTKLASGAGKAWLADAPHKPLSSYRKRARTTVRKTTATAKDTP
ncbi:hypothetical protein ACPW96_22835 [Micromonospora sp. DT81.3]|uniref:hypothetical protein n=1 Tax=Micromonospora sp. DT81.3 TaxID=3416523 RepID=UPI003CEE8B84